MNPSDTVRAAKGIPLGALFLLVAIVAIIVTQLCLLREFDIAIDKLLSSAIVRGIWGGLFGLVIGLHDLRRGRGAMIGISVGLAVGAATGPIALLSIKAPSTVLAVATASGIGLIAIATVYRAVNTNDPVSSRRLAGKERK